MSRSVFAALITALLALAGCSGGPGPATGDAGPLPIDAPAPSDVGTDASGAPDVGAPMDAGFDIYVFDRPTPPDVPPIDVPSPDVPPDAASPVADAAADRPDAPDVPAGCDADAGRCGDRCLDLASDPANCGACGMSCGALPGVAASAVRCEAGRCALTGACLAGRGDCDGEAANGCEADLAQVGTCGRCGNACVAPANAYPTCDAGACGTACLRGYADCDRAAANGCETSLTADRANCGACGTSCPDEPNAAGVCVEGRCGFTCRAGFANCDDLPNGCETEGFCTRDAVLFSDGFEGGDSLAANWNASDDWHAVNGEYYRGTYGLHGTWYSDAFASRCYEHGEIYLARDIDLTAALSAEITFYERATAGTLDNLAVVGSSDGGATWRLIGSTVGSATAWRPRTVPLTTFLGQTRVRFGFVFRNGCGDCCDAEWRLDEVAVRARVRAP